MNTIRHNAKATTTTGERKMTKQEANQKMMDVVCTAARRQVNVEFEGVDHHDIVANAADAVQAEAAAAGIVFMDRIGAADREDFENMKDAFNAEIRKHAAATGAVIAAAEKAAGTSMASMRAAKAFFAA